MADSTLLDAAWKEFSDALDTEIADWKQAVIAGMRERHGTETREEGFTGTVKDKLGRQVHFVNGRRVKKAQQPSDTGKTAGKQKPGGAMAKTDALLQKSGVQTLSGSVADARAAGQKFMDDFKNLKGDLSGAFADLHERAGKIANSVIEKTQGIWHKLGAAGSKIKNTTKAVYKQLENRYGRAAAIAIFAAGHVVGLGTPLVVVPGSTLIGMAPFVAMAETYLQASKALGALKGKSAIPTIPPDKIEVVAKQVVEHLVSKSAKTESREARESTARILPVPDWRQKDHYSCGAAATGAVMQGYYHVGPESIDEWKQLLGTTLAKSTDPQAIIRVGQSLGLHIEAKDGMTLEDLASYTEHGWPVIVCVQDYGNRRQQGAEYAYGHYLTVIGVVDGHVICQDSSEENVLKPDADSIQEPGRVMIDGKTFLSVWHDQGADGAKYLQFGIAVGPPA